MQPIPKIALPYLIIIIATLLVGIYAYSFFANSAQADVAKDAAIKKDPDMVELNQTQLESVKIEPAENYNFATEKEAVGTVAYHEHAGTEAADLSVKVIIANIPESDSPFIHVGQVVKAKLAAYPEIIFDGKVIALGGNAWDSGGNPAIDPNTHRITVRCEIPDAKNQLYPGMLAAITIQTEKPSESVAVPVNGIVRKGDGTMTVWVTDDRRHFKARVVKVGLQQNGYDQILEGLNPQELVATDGALFLDNSITDNAQ